MRGVFLEPCFGRVFAQHEFENERLRAIRVFETVDGRDVRMVQRGEDFGLTLEASEAIRVSGERRGQHLQRHLGFSLASVARYTSPCRRDGFCEFSTAGDHVPPGRSLPQSPRHLHKKMFIDTVLLTCFRATRTRRALVRFVES
jgi:hypothetical protein